MKEVECWEKAEKIRDYILQKVRNLLANKQNIKSPHKLKLGAYNALKYIDSIDPIKKRISV